MTPPSGTDGGEAPAVVTPGPPSQAVVDRADERRRVRESRRTAKLEARRKRAEVRAVAARDASTARREAALALAAERVDHQTAAQHSPEVDDRPDDVGEPEPAVEPEPAQEPVPLSEVLARAGAFDRPSPAPEPDRSPEPVRVRPVPATSDDDGIVEPPREPAVPLAERLRSGGSGRGRRRLVSVLAGVIGAAGLICSVVLAFGALLVALGSTDGSVYDTVSGICDALVGPLRDVVSFSGANADVKEALVAWGAGAIAYLVVGVVAQSLLRAAVED